MGASTVSPPPHQESSGKNLAQHFLPVLTTSSPLECRFLVEGVVVIHLDLKEVEVEFDC
jgi:hypothetical protein